MTELLNVLAIIAYAHEHTASHVVEHLCW